MRILTLLIAASLAGGCVSKGKYEELQTSYDELRAEQDKTLAERDRALESRKELQAKIDKRMDAFAGVYKDMIKLQQDGVAKVKVEDGRALVSLPSDVLFASGSAELTDEGKAAVSKVAKGLAGVDARFQVEGHTDSDAIQSKQYPDNWHLGAARALTVTEAMIAAGFPADRVSAASYGQTMPVASNADDGGKAQNRRIEIVLVPDLSEVLPYGRIAKEMQKGEGGGKNGKKKGDGEKKEAEKKKEGAE